MTPPYTLKKITDSKDSAPDFGFGEHGQMHMCADDFDARDTGFTYHRMNPNVHSGFGHRHENAEEVYVVLSGSGRVKLDDEIIEIERLDTIRVAPEVWRSFSAGPEGLEAIAFGPRHANDGEVDPQWWTE
jgi:mannose-6-phosphate isomerase-like protein (cupin superfamily)